MKKLFTILSLLLAGLTSGFAEDYSARAFITMDGMTLRLRESANFNDGFTNGACASDNNQVAMAAYVNGTRYIQWGCKNLEGLRLAVKSTAQTFNLTFSDVIGTLYIIDTRDGSSTLIVDGESKEYAIYASEIGNDIVDRFYISKMPANIQELPSSLGTFVSDKKVASVTGAVLYEIIATDGVSNITFQEVNMTNGLAAGTPVLYQKTDATAFVTFTDDAPINGVYAYANGFVGLLPGNNSQEEHMLDGDLWALVSDGKLKFVDTYCTLTPGHAYIDMNAINPQQPAPGRRRLMIGRSGIVTDVENVAAEVKGARKSIENGKIVILKNGIKYNVAGQMMK